MKKVLSACLVALAGTFGAAENAEAIAISLSPSPQTATIGDTVSFDIIVSGLLEDGVGEEALGDFDFDIVMSNPAVATFTGFTFSSLLGIVDVETISGQSGSANTVLDIFSVSLLDVASLMALQPDSAFSLGTLTFVAAAVGTTDIFIDTADPFLRIGDEWGNPIAGATYSPGTLTVTAGGGPPQGVPEPTSLMLIGMGLAGAFATRRRIRR